MAAPNDPLQTRRQRAVVSVRSGGSPGTVIVVLLVVVVLGLGGVLGYRAYQSANIPIPAIAPVSSAVPGSVVIPRPEPLAEPPQPAAVAAAPPAVAPAPEAAPVPAPPVAAAQSPASEEKPVQVAAAETAPQPETVRAPAPAPATRPEAVVAAVPPPPEPAIPAPAAESPSPPPAPAPVAESPPPPAAPATVAQAQPPMAQAPTAQPEEPDAPPDQSGWMRDPESGCRVWLPSWLRGKPYMMRYAGPCRAGRAEGIGTATMMVMPNDHSPQHLRGHFRDGVYYGTSLIPNEVAPLSNNDFLIALPTGGLIGAEFWIHQIFDSDATVRLCERSGGTVIAVASGHLAALDEEAVKRFMLQAGAAYAEACPSTRQVRVHVVPPAHRRVRDGNRTAFKPEMAQGEVSKLDTRVPEIYGYRNDEAAAEERRRRAERSRQRQQEYAERAAATKTAFKAFTTTNGVASWVKAEQVDANPFRWDGKVVAMRVDFQRMVSPSTALVAGQNGGRLLLTEVPSDLFAEPATVVIAGRVGARRNAEIPGGGGGSQTLSLVQLALVKAHLCTVRGCMDIFEWLGHDYEKFPWGGDQARFLE